MHESPWAPAANSRSLRGRFFWQPNSEDSQVAGTGLAQLAECIGRPSVLLTTDDAGAIFVAEHGNELRQWFLFPQAPMHLPRQLAGKYSMYQLCLNLGVPCPETTVPSSFDEANLFAEGVCYPVIAKLTSPWGFRGAKLRSTMILSDRSSLEDFCRRCEDDGVGFMLQEFIPGGPGQDWFVHGYCGADGTCRPIFSGVKERSYPAHAGLTSLGRATANPRLVDEMSQLVSRLAYRGIFDLDLRFDSRDGQYKLLDFNPRLGAQFRLFHDSAGIDVVRAQYLDMSGVSIPQGEQASGRRFLVENYDPLGALAYWRRGELDFKVWAASLRGVDETAWFARDDLRPFGLMCLRMGWRLATRPLTVRMARGGPGRRPKASATARTQPRYVEGNRQASWTRPARQQRVQETRQRKAVGV